MANDLLLVTYRDYSNEIGSMSFRVPVLTAANFDAQEVLHDALANAIADLTIGQEAKQMVTHIQDTSDATPVSAVAQRELKWLVTYLGADGVMYRTEIPTPDLTDISLLIVDSDECDLTDADWVAFITAFEALVLDAAGGACTVKSARLVGRNT